MAAVDQTTSDGESAATLPRGVVAAARRLWFEAGRTDRPDPPSSRHHPGDLDDVDRELLQMLFAPLSLEPDWPDPAAPIPVTGGFVHAEVLDDDIDLFADVLDAIGPQGPEAVAAAAQELRLPVTPYRRLRAVEGLSNDVPALRQQADPDWATAKTVVDMSTHWAGPLTTALLADAGARVIKIDPICRPDGFLARPRLYDHLNRSKEIIDLDLRLDGDRCRFEALIASADLLAESFSRRVMTNLGYGPDRLKAISPSLRTLSIKAFPAGSAEQDWIGYGPAVHAASGLAYGGSQAATNDPVPAPIAYPDLLAALTAYGEGLRLLGGGVGHREVSLMGSIAPLVRQLIGQPDPVGRSDGDER